jgi:uncharacterized membrane protein
MKNHTVRKSMARRLWLAGLTRLSKADRKRLFLLLRRSRISRDTHEEFESTLTFGQRVADQVAKFGGSWTFIMTFGVMLAAWVIANTWMMSNNAFDPYPFIFLNLILSMLAAIQAPVIMMSQNRQSTKDRLAAQHDYEVNLKAELEVMALHDKLDAMRIDLIEQLLKSQSEQLALLQELVAKSAVKEPTSKRMQQ